MRLFVIFCLTSLLFAYTPLQYTQDSKGSKTFLDVLASPRGQNHSKFLFRDFLQLSIDGSGKDNEDIADDPKVLTVFIFNFFACIVCCGFIQGVLVLSKNMIAKLSILRKNYKQYQGFVKFSEFKRSYLLANPQTSSDN